MVPTTALDLGAKAKYIISVTPSAKAAIEATVIKNGWKIDTKYNYVFDGYVIELPKLVAGLLSKIPNVLTVEEDKPVAGLAIQNTQSPTPAWGLDRVDQREKVGLTGSVSAYGYRSAGAGATIYIGDTGIYPHNDLAGRISPSGYSSINDGNGTVDCNGHGTHVAATAAGTQYGLAKNARVVPVRLLNCAGSGQYSGVIAALDWILSPENPNPKTQAVLNLSIGGAGSASMNAAILRLTNAGITVVAAAGNGNQNLNSTFYQSYINLGNSGAIIVGGGTANTTHAIYPPYVVSGVTYTSTYGSRVDVQGWFENVRTTGAIPGSGFTLVGSDFNQSYMTFTGTSSATAQLGGVVTVLQSYYKSQTNTTLTSQQMRTILKNTGIPQGGDISKNIGPFPDMLAALNFMQQILNSESFFESSLYVYPNPSNGIFTLVSGSNKIEEIEVFDVTGKVIMSKEEFDLSTNQISIDIASASQGIYFLKITANNQSIVKRIIKN